MEKNLCVTCKHLEEIALGEMYGASAFMGTGGYIKVCGVNKLELPEHEGKITECEHYEKKGE